MADLPATLRDLGYKLSYDSYRGWRIPNNAGLIIWQRDDRSWGWNHFSKGDGGDAISFLTEWEGMSRKKAIETLIPFAVEQDTGLDNQKNIFPDLPESKIPPSLWITNATKEVRNFQKRLLKGNYLDVWDWLFARGLNKATIRKASLGWIPKESWDMRQTWGLKDIINGQTVIQKIYIPSGLSIPAFNHSKEVIRVRIRRFNNEERPYHIIAGSCTRPLIIGDLGKPIVVVESDLDAWLIHQEAGDLVTAVSLGSAGGKPDDNLGLYLHKASRILIALDNDLPGRNASKWWRVTYSKAKNWPVPWGKDPSEAFGCHPKLIRKWINGELTTR